MDIQIYNQTLTQLFVQYFEKLKSGDRNDTLKFRIQGFIQAGETLGIISKLDANKVMESTHISVFGVSIEERKSKKDAFKTALKERDDKYFQLPPNQR